jgi:hypothetical protein
VLQRKLPREPAAELHRSRLAVCQPSGDDLMKVFRVG